MSNKAFRIRNKFVLGLASWLNELQLAGKESRERTKIVALLSNHLQDLEKSRQELLTQFANKDDKGKPVIKEREDGVKVFDIPEEKIPEFNVEYQKLMDEEFVLDVLEGNKEKLKVVKDLVLSTNYQFGPRPGDSEEEKAGKVRQANDYADWCEAFEALDLDA